MPRRSHKKSRQGCQECKRRHLKCDETKPKCINCVTARLQCPYETEKCMVSNYGSGPQRDSPHDGGTPANSTPSRSPANSVSFPALAKIPPDSSLNMLHLELLYNWSQGLYKSALVSADGAELYADTCIKHGLQFPFLMRQILATSALNLSIRRPDRRAFYHQHATQLQSEALAGFNATLGGLNETNIVAAFLVSSLIGMHAFCETFAYREDSFNDTLDSLIGCINLLQGIRSLISNWWTYLSSSELKPILVTAHDKLEEYKDRPVHFKDLERLISTADIGAASREAYKQTLDELGQIFAVQGDLQEPEASLSANMIFSWFVIVPKDYVELLSARRPEALIILSYYAVALHHRRCFWAAGDAGRFLIEGISAHLGKHWDQLLAWPCSMAAS